MDTHTLNQLLNLHHGLWDMKDKVEYFGATYEVFKPSHAGFSRIIVPGKFGKNIIYITQNLNKSSYGTLEIQRAAKAGKVVRITWIVDPSDGDFKYIGVIKTNEEEIIIESYSSFGTQILYSTNPSYQTTKSQY